MTADGTLLDFWRSAAGNDGLSDLRVRKPDGQTSYLQVDSLGRPVHLQDPAGTAFWVNSYLDGDRVDVTVANQPGSAWRGIINVPGLGSAASFSTPVGVRPRLFAPSAAPTSDNLDLVEDWFCGRDVQHAIRQIVTGFCLIGAAAAIVAATPLVGYLTILACFAPGLDGLVVDAIELGICGDVRTAAQLALNTSAYQYASLSEPLSPIRPSPPVSRFAVRGVVRETAPNPTPLLPGASVELVGGPDAAKVSADQNGAFTLQNVSAQTGMIRASLSGYETETKTVIVAADVVVDFALGHTWPTPLLFMLNRLPVIDGLKFKRVPGGPSYYSSSPPVAVYGSPAPFSGEVGAIAHEVCHAHQDRLARAIGQPIGGWYDTDEGKSFLELTGWSRSGPEPPCERGWCGYPNALEDSAQVCATWYDPGGSWEPGFLRDFAPKRFQWAQRWLPR
jgi:hypothetical protein